MTTQNATSQAEVRAAVDRLVEAVRTGDLATLKTIFAPDIVSFDIQPPLRHPGAATKQASWEMVFEAFALPLEYEVLDPTVLVDGDLAVVYSLNHMNATMNAGPKIDYWLRATSTWQRIDGEWMIVHDHVSVPTNFLEGTAAMDLTP
ncbi:MAG TPA: nuclear transport factor 2 family protein [Kribbella sp.]